MSTKLKAGTATSGAVIEADTAGILEIQSGSTPTTAITVDASQNVGIGTSSPSAITGYKSVSVNGTTGSLIDSFTNGTLTGRIETGTNLYAINAQGASTPLILGTVNTERMRINTSGNVLVNTTTAILSGTTMSVSGNTGAGLGLISYVNTNSSTKKWSTGPDTNGNFVVFNDASAGMYMGYGATSWTANSDERLKTDLKPIENAVDKVNQLRSVTGRFKTDDESVSRSFLIAQDVQKVLPEAVSEFDGNLGVQYTEVIPLLVASIKELNAKVEALEAQLGAK